MILLRSLGNAEIDTGVATLTPSQEIVFAAALYLILERGKRVSRRRLASLLWPSVEDKARAHRLRQAILQLKKLGFTLSADRDLLYCSPHDVQSDTAELTRTGFETLGPIDSVEFLPGYSPTFSDAFRDWVETRREEIHALITRSLVVDLNAARTKGDWVRCDRIARQCALLDPFNEAAVLARAESSAMRGGKKQAVDMLDRYLADVGSHNQDLRLLAAILRKRISNRIPDTGSIGVQECSFVGRDGEWEALTLQLFAARDGAGGACLVTGEAGIGKTRLASELAKFAALEGIQTSRTACRRSDVDRPLSAFVDLVPQLSVLRGALGCSQETISALKRLTEFDGRASSGPSWLEDSGSTYAKMRAAIIDLIDAIADEQPLLITLDDVQWLDRTSIRLLVELFPWAKTRKVLFILTERVGASALNNHLCADDLRTVMLSPLASPSATALVREVLERGCQETGPELIQRLMSLGEGNPFFLQELGSHSLETGQQQEFPLSITAIIDDRVARLSNEALHVLQACAVLGVNASVERVEGLLEYKSHLLLSAVQELSVAGMLLTESESSPECAPRITVRHDLISTAVLKRLGKPALAFLHRRAGTVLERETLGDSARTSILWACAFHWRNAGDRERAFRAARSCADHLLEVGLPHDAAKSFEGVLGYCVTDEQRLSVLSRLAVALQMDGQWERSKEILRRARQLQATTAPNANTHDEVEFALFDARWRVSLENAALLNDLKACTQSEDAPISHRVACGLLGLKVATQLNRRDVMGELYLSMGPLLENPLIALLTKFEVEMIYHSTCGDPQKASQATDGLLKAVRTEPNPYTVSRALGNIGIAYRLAGRKKDAEAVFREVLALSIAHGHRTRISFAVLSLVRMYLTDGDVSLARNTMQEFDALRLVDDDLHRRADHLYLLARLALEEGRIEEASARYVALAADASTVWSIHRRAAVLALGVRVEIQKELSPDQLRPIVAQLEEVHLQNRSSGWQDFETQALVLGLRYCGEQEKGLHLLIDYVTLHRREKWPVPEDLTVLLRELGETTRSRPREESNPSPVFAEAMHCLPRLSQIASSTPNSGVARHR